VGGSAAVAEHGETGEAIRIAGSMTDQTERKMTDPLTGLPNRMYFIEHLERRLERARIDQTWDFPTLSLAMERFKVLNESLGHVGGDAFLTETAFPVDRCHGAVDRACRSGDRAAEWS